MTPSQDRTPDPRLVEECAKAAAKAVMPHIQWGMLTSTAQESFQLQAAAVLSKAAELQGPVVATKLAADLLQEFDMLMDEFSRLKREYEPPYVHYASWAAPAVRAALDSEQERAG